MLDLLWLIPALPFAGFLLLTLAGRLPRAVIAGIGCGTVGVGAIFSLLLCHRFLTAPPPDHAFTQSLWTWFDVAGLAPGIAFHLDALSLVMISVITGVGFLIHVYSAEYMRDDEGFQRFFAFLNLFVGFMLVLVLADNFVLLLLGWEGVGLCSYLLIGFWYREPANGAAARKAFVVTRIGDTALLLGLFLLFASLGTLHFQEAFAAASLAWEPGSGLAVAAALLILGGAVGKSAQLPLQTWLPDAMAGPTPVSALIHAATMVTAGVYLIARCHVLFELAPAVLLVVAIVGAATLLTAGFSALVQHDIKRVLAYSTISQLGYMFLALGVGAWSAAMFHFVTHALFKALLFLAAGALILALHHEQDMRKMGGLRHKLPAVFWTFLIGSVSLAALPLIGSGFYSKEKILWDVWISPLGGPAFWAVGVAGAVVTALYTFRMVFLVFFGESRGARVEHRPGPAVLAVLVILAVFSTFAGGIELPHTFGHVTFFSDFLDTALASLVVLPPGLDAELWALLLVASALVLAGAGVAWWLYGKRTQTSDTMGAAPPRDPLLRFWFAGWGFDAVYDTLLVRPYQFLARRNRRDLVDLGPVFIAALARGLHTLLSETQTGRLRWYASVLVAGTLVLLLLAFAQ
ncbi:MAG: NADH-quinone oxidoreductase subunit L [Puniceicoccaceae bacterium]|nr:MAG: NADH-quinone oxidoreductase subunit L [Puniceicoccaceae bacterium]